jgi:hypothetical protein
MPDSARAPRVAMRTTFGRDVTPDPALIAHASPSDPRLRPLPRRRFAVPRSALIWLLVVAVGSIPLWVIHRGHSPATPALAMVSPPPPTAPVATPTPPPAPAALPAPLPEVAPTLPPAEKARLDLLSSDLWIHPLAGPTRRMPIRDGRLFGAERIGDRPAECMGGHCGVDLGGTMGEPVYAVHEGVVERVVRGPNEEHGGHYVRILHREGTIVSQYFHLKAIPAAIIPGTQVKAGDVIGWVGRSGVKRSAPHLHFTISVQEPNGQNARYVDPEPLVALWPLRAVQAGPDGAPELESGVPVGLARGFVRRKFRHPKLAAHSRAHSANVAD